MEILLRKLQKSIRHLQILDKIFREESFPEKKEYLTAQQNIKSLSKKGDPVSFVDELYVGGKKGRGPKGYGRQMILSDIFEYIFNGRGYYFAARSNKNKKIYIKIILNFINQLMILDSLTVNYKLRAKALEKLRKSLGRDFFKENQFELEHQGLLLLNKDLGFDTVDETVPENIVLKLDPSGRMNEKSARKRLNEYYDSLLPKTGGGLWNELIVYLYLLRINAGYILPLLLNQRILSLTKQPLKPPDFLVIKYDGNFVGVEVGGGKEIQSGDFSSTTGIQMVTTENTNIPPRCPVCGKWILFCKKVINDYSDINLNPLLHIKEHIRCPHECDLFPYEAILDGKCPYVQYLGETSLKTTRQKIKFSSKYHYHYKCVLKAKDKKALDLVEKQRQRFKRFRDSNKSEESPPQKKINCLVSNYPYVRGLSTFEKPKKEDTVCFKNYKRSKNCNYCGYVDECMRNTKLEKILEKHSIKQINKLLNKIKI